MSLDLHLRKRGLPIYVQVRDQIIHMICTGRLKPGDRLPTVRALGEQYDISRNTALRAYQELERAGWATIDRHNAVCVRKLPDQSPQAPDLSVEAVQRFHDALECAFAAGVSAEDFKRVAEREITEKWTQERSDSEYVVLVSEDIYGWQQDVEDLRSVAQLPVRWVPLSDIRRYGYWALGDIRRLRLVVSTFYRYKEVRERLSRISTPVFPSTPVTDPQVVVEVAKYNRPDVRVAVVAHDPGFIEALSFFANQSLYDAQIVGHASLTDPEGVRLVLEQADVIAANFWAAGEPHSELIKDKPTFVLGSRLDPNSLQLLRQVLESEPQP